MKRINTNSNGRMPLWQKDLDWLQRGYTEPIEALIASLGLPMTHFVVSGCVPYRPNPARIAMPAGWFCWGGEILPVKSLAPTSVAGFTDPVVRLTRVAFAHPDGARPFVRPDLTTQQVGNVWQDDYLRPSVAERSASFISGVRLGTGAWTLADIISHRNREGESPWVSLTGNGYSVQYKHIGRHVVVKGMLASETPCRGMPLPLTDPTVLSYTDADHYILIEGDAITYYGGVGQGLIPPTTYINGLSYIADTPYLEPDTDPNTISDEPQG